MSYKSLKAKILASWKGKAESSKMDIAFKIHSFLNEKNMNNRDLAEKLGSSPAYITKLLRGDQNFSIESMHKIADALDVEVCIHFARKNTKVHWFEVIEQQKKTPNKQIRTNGPNVRLKEEMEFCA